MATPGGRFPDAETLAICERFSLWMRQGGGLPVRGRPLPGSASPGLDFEGFSEYSPGRDIRRLDWPLYVRTRRFYVREYADESAGLLLVLLDASGSMGVGDPPKFALARRLAAVLAFAALRELHQVVIGVLHAGRTVWLPPLAGLDSAPEAFRFLGRFVPRGPTDLAGALTALPVRGARGDAVLVGDFLDPRGADRGLLALARQGFRVDLCRVVAEGEFDVPPPGVRLRDPEGEHVRPAPLDTASRARLEAAITAHRLALDDAARRVGALLLNLPADLALPQALERVFAAIG
ncbi:MAG: DUF58 domain-containing protein, partial [Myxococcales bacterium]|nr:DUF58 domain-containing protein [Myxococcales bacterium]